MTYLDTAEAETSARHLLAQIRMNITVLAEEAAELDDDERRSFRLDAAAGGRRYAGGLQADIESGRVDEHTLRKADLVARAAGCAGWLSASGMGGTSQGRLVLSALIEEGVFAFYPAVPGQWVACYRLVAPAC
jgi:hypothetical protein